MKLTESQVKKYQAISKKLAKERKAITFYRKNESGLAQFRLTALNTIFDLTIRQITGKPQLKETKENICFWLSGNGGEKEIIENYCNKLETVTGKTIIFLVFCKDYTNSVNKVK